METTAIRKIIHVDMDAFYASVEQRDKPELRGKAVVVGGKPTGRGVVAAASYEARKYGVRSAMPCRTAARLCPDAIFMPARFSVYRDVSQAIRAIFHEYTDLVEPLSLDEAFLDVSENKKGIPSATQIAQEIRARIKAELGLTASAGVGHTKFIAKVASEVNKPDGLTVVRPREAEAFIEGLAIRQFPGVGPVTEQKMIKLGIRTGRDLKAWPLDKLLRTFGKTGRYYYNIVRGIDRRQVSPYRERKSISHERTFAVDIDDRTEIQRHIEKLAGELASGMAKKNVAGKTITLKVRYANFESITRSKTLRTAVNDRATLERVAAELLQHSEAGARKVRLLGLGVSNLIDPEAPEPEYEQLRLPFADYGWDGAEDFTRFGEEDRF